MTTIGTRVCVCVCARCIFNGRSVCAGTRLLSVRFFPGQNSCRNAILVFIARRLLCIIRVCVYIYIYSKSSAQKTRVQIRVNLYTYVFVPQRRRIMVENLKTRRRKKKKRINVRISVHIGRVRRQNGNEFVQTGAKFLLAYRHPRRELSAWKGEKTKPAYVHTHTNIHIVQTTRKLRKKNSNETKDRRVIFLRIIIKKETGLVRIFWVFFSSS